MPVNIHKILTMISVLVLSLPAFATDLPDYYPESFDRWGMINQVDLDNLVIVVNDINIHVTRDLRVNTPNTRFALGRSLQPGMKIGFGTSGSRAITGPVPEVWVLPADYAPPHNKAGPTHERRKNRD